MNSILIPAIVLVVLISGCIDKGASFSSLYDNGQGSIIPDLFINVPPSGSSVRGSAVIFFSSNGVQSPEVSVDGNTWTLASSGDTILSDISGYDVLTETNFILQIRGINTLGEMVSDAVTIVKDETAPLVLFHNPIQGGLVNSPTVLSFQDSDLLSPEASIDGTNWIRVISGTTTLADFPQFSSVAASDPFTLLLRGEDAAGNPGSGSVDLVREPVEASSFNNSITVYFDTSLSGAGVSTDVVNIPLVVRISDPAIISAVHPGAPDIRFFDTDGNQWLDYEIERWDQGNNLAEVWVLVPRVDGNSNTDFITLYYDDNPDFTVPGNQNASAVFSTGNDFAGVWHLKENPAGVIGDSTGNSYDGTANSMDAANLVDGAMGKGYTFNGSDEWIDLTNFDVTTSNATFCAWINVGSYDNSDGILFSRGASIDGLNLRSNGGLFLGYHWNDDSNTWGWTGPVFGSGEWVFAAITIQPSGGHVGYVGAGGTFTALTNPITSATNLRINSLEIGRDSYGGRMFDGIIDEARVSTVVRSPDWLKISYYNQRPGGTMVSLCDGNDITPPIVAIINSGTVYAPETVSFANSEPASPIVSVDNTNWITAVSGVTKFSDVPGFDAMADGSFTLYLKDTDGCRNTGIASAPLTKDSYDAAFFAGSVDLYFDTTPAGADVSTLVDNFTLLVRLGPAESAVIDAVQPGAPDIRFLDSDGVTFLEYEIERWDQASDVAEVWVLVPRIDGNSNTDYITMLYDDTNDGTIPDDQNPAGVFSTGNDFSGVWHLKEDPSGILYDSTGHSYDGASVAMDAGNQVDGVVGKGLQFNGIDEWIDIAAFNELVTNVTFSAWINTVTYAEYEGILFSRGSTVCGINILDNAGLSFGYHWDNAVNTYSWTGPGFNTGEWVYVAVTIQPAGGHIAYVGAGGTLASSTNNVTSAINRGIDNLKIGRDNIDGRLFDGIIDEARVSAAVRSPEWIKLTYENQKPGQTLVTVVP